MVEDMDRDSSIYVALFYVSASSCCHLVMCYLACSQQCSWLGTWQGRKTDYCM